MATVENDQIWLYCHFCHFCKIIKEPETSFESPELSQKNMLEMPVMMPQLLKSVDFTKTQKPRYLKLAKVQQMQLFNYCHKELHVRCCRGQKRKKKEKEKMTTSI